MIVATSDFNMGAMENKGLNIFNTKYVLASQATATDTDFANIERGRPRVLPQLDRQPRHLPRLVPAQPEGRPDGLPRPGVQHGHGGQPSARAVKRIEDVRVLRTVQFPEDAGPMAHPVRPTATSRSTTSTPSPSTKRRRSGAHAAHLVGREGFAKGMKLYFERHDGQAVTCDDFAQAMADANPAALAQHLEQFKRWYSQAGTPRARRGPVRRRRPPYTLTLSQSCPPTPGQPSKQPFVIPWLGLLTRRAALPLQLRAKPPRHHHAHAGADRAEQLHLRVDSAPCPRCCAASQRPGGAGRDYSDAELLTLLAHDSDAFNRWEAGQRLALRAIKAIAAARPAPEILPPFRPCAVLRDPQLDAAFKDLVLTLPSEATSPSSWTWSIRSACTPCAKPCACSWPRPAGRLAGPGSHQRHRRLPPRRVSPAAAPWPAWRCPCCAWPRTTGDTVWPGKAYQRFKDAGNMTDRFNALAALVGSGHALAARRWSASTRCSSTSAGHRQVVCPAGRRPTAAATCCPPCAS
jgi:aminopeptidase N